MKKLILILLLLVLFMTACGSTENSNSDSPNNNNLGDMINSNNDNGEIEFVSDSLPDGLDFNGVVINLLVQEDSWKEKEFLAPELTGDVIDDAVYNRNIAVEERLNIKLNVISGPGWENWGSMASQIRNSIMAGDHSYDLIAGWSARAPALALDGLFMDLQELSDVEQSKPG